MPVIVSIKSKYFLREKMRAIKQELGEDPKKDSSSLIEKVKKGNYPQEVKDNVEAMRKQFEKKDEQEKPNDEQK